MSGFYITSCFAPIETTVYRDENGNVISRDDSNLAEERDWLPEFTEWITTEEGTTKVLNELSPEDSVGKGWLDIIGEYLDDNNMLVDDSAVDAVIGVVLNTGEMGDDDVTDASARKIVVDAVSDFVIYHARRAFNVNQEHATVHRGELITGGVGDFAGLGTQSDVYESVELLSWLSYFEGYSREVDYKV